MDEENTIIENIEDITIEKEMKTSYLDYSMSVIIGRAIPDIRDGLKPVHRRTLYSLHTTGTHYNQAYKKSARIVGDVIGKYHPHGDQAVYNTLVRMAQDFSMRYTLVDGQGNFGSIDGDAPAAMRYTEVRLKKISNQLLADLEKNTVNMVENYDGSLVEPEIFPTQLPILFINGSSGIAVGMATSIPPHNIKELIDAFIAFVDNKNISTFELMEYLKGPDFPTGGIIYGKNSILNAYETGRGSVVLRAKYHVEEKKGRDSLIIDEIPYQTNKSKILENIANLVKLKKINDISDLRDESDKDGMRIVIELKRDTIPEVVMNLLYKHTQLQTVFSVNLLAIVNKQPKQFSLIDYFRYFLGHRKEVVKRRTIFDLNKAEKRAHIIEGLKIALDKLDLVIKIIRASKNREEAKNALQKELPLSDLQVNAILDMQLYKLTGLEIDKLNTEYAELQKKINYYKELLSNEEMMINLIKEETISASKEFEDERRTEIIDYEISGFNKEDFIPDDDFIIIFTKEGYIKRSDLNSYNNQNRGTIGKRGLGLKDDDFTKRIFVASAHEYILIFTEKGKLYWKKVHEIPESESNSKGRPINRIIDIDEGDSVCSIINIKEFSDNTNVVVMSEKGYIKKTPLSSFSNPRKGGIIAVKVSENDRIIEAQESNGSNDIIIGTREGKAIKFNEKDIRETGRNTRGVRAIRLKGDDIVVAADIIREESKYILCVSENGIGKKSSIDDYRIQRRGGSGLINMKINDKTGKVIGLLTLDDKDDIILCSKNGIVNKQSSDNMRQQGRNTQGVRIIKLRGDDKLVSLEKIVVSDEIPQEEEEEI